MGYMFAMKRACVKKPHVAHPPVIPVLGRLGGGRPCLRKIR